MGMVSIDTSSVSGNFDYYICLVGWFLVIIYLFIKSLVSCVCKRAGYTDWSWCPYTVCI